MCVTVHRIFIFIRCSSLKCQKLCIFTNYQKVAYFFVQKILDLPFFPFVSSQYDSMSALCLFCHGVQL